MAEQPTTDRTDDADARGEHDYDTHRPKDAEQPDSSPVHRQPNTYVAGEHGTQQVTAPPSSRRADSGDKPRRKASSTDK